MQENNHWMRRRGRSLLRRLAVLEAGGDFSDGVIAYEGAWLDGETFVSFDKQAVTLLSRQDEAAQLLS